jgi:hypothetical protein
VAALERDVAAAQRFLDLAQQRFENGVGSYLNVLTAQTTLYSAQQALVSARLTRLATLVNLYKDLGSGWIQHTGDTPAAEDIGSLAPPENHAPCGTYCRQSGRRRPTARWLPDRYACYRLRHRAHLILPGEWPVAAVTMVAPNGNAMAITASHSCPVANASARLVGRKPAC